MDGVQAPQLLPVWAVTAAVVAVAVIVYPVVVPVQGFNGKTPPMSTE